MYRYRDEGWERVANTIGSCIEVPLTLIKCELFETLHIYRGTILNPEPSANETLYKIIGLNTAAKKLRESKANSSGTNLQLS